jgi:hypothetical protein
VHTRWALRSGVTPGELEAIGLEDPGGLDRRSRAAVAYASALARLASGRRRRASLRRSSPS